MESYEILLQDGSKLKLCGLTVTHVVYGTDWRWDHQWSTGGVKYPMPHEFHELLGPKVNDTSVIRSVKVFKYEEVLFIRIFAWFQDILAYMQEWLLDEKYIDAADEVWRKWIQGLSKLNGVYDG